MLKKYSIYTLVCSPNENNPNLVNNTRLGLFFTRDYFGLIIRFE